VIYDQNFDVDEFSGEWSIVEDERKGEELGWSQMKGEVLNESGFLSEIDNQSGMILKEERCRLVSCIAILIEKKILLQSIPR
jgi:hypothetical protein